MQQTLDSLIHRVALIEAIVLAPASPTVDRPAKENTRGFHEHWQSKLERRSASLDTELKSGTSSTVSRDGRFATYNPTGTSAGVFTPGGHTRVRWSDRLTPSNPTTEHLKSVLVSVEDQNPGLSAANPMHTRLMRTEYLRAIERLAQKKSSGIGKTAHGFSVRDSTAKGGIKYLTQNALLARVFPGRRGKRKLTTKTQ